eukprot:4724077-Amphidinium_carterae.2
MTAQPAGNRGQFPGKLPKSEGQNNGAYASSNASNSDKSNSNQRSTVDGISFDTFSNFVHNHTYIKACPDRKLTASAGIDLSSVPFFIQHKTPKQWDIQKLAKICFAIFAVCAQTHLTVSVFHHMISAKVTRAQKHPRLAFPVRLEPSAVLVLGPFSYRYASDSASSQCIQCGESSSSPEHFVTMAKLDYLGETQYNYVLGSDTAEHCGLGDGL